MLSASFPDFRGRPGDLRFFLNLIKPASNRFADRAISFITAGHTYSGFVFGQRHHTQCFLSHAQLAGHTTTKCLWRMRMRHTQKL
jgi:hypothetical protein